MAHCITNIDHVFCPEKGEFADTWHHLQTNVEGRIALDGSNIAPVFCPVVQTGFKPDFEAPISTVPADLADELKANPLSSWKMILADLRANGDGVVPLHVAKEGYAVHQNRELFASMVKAAKEVLGEDNFEVATVGTLGGYAHFFVSIAIKGEFEGWTVGERDAWKSFFNLVSSHNGQVASQTLLSLIRIVCMNTVQASIADANESGQSAKIKHTANSAALITPEAFESNLRLWVEERAKMQATLLALKGQPMTLDGFRAFAAGVHSNRSTDLLTTHSFNRVGQLSELFVRGRGNSGQTRYDALNAFTEYYTSGAGVGNPATVKTNKRLASASFGQGNVWKQTALAVLGNEREFAATCARGEMLYSDKLAVMAAAN